MADYECDIEDFRELLIDLGDTTEDAPFSIKIKKCNTVAKCQTIRDDLLWASQDKGWSTYVDLRETSLVNASNVMSQLFQDCDLLVYAPNIPNNATSLYCAFKNCTNLKEIPTIPSGVTSLSNAFYNCTSLEEVPDLPTSITNMSYAFYNCTGLEEAPDIPANVINMEYAFYNCTGLVNPPFIPSGVTNMNYCFYNCTSLVRTPVLPNDVGGSSVSDENLSYCFANCTSLECKTLRFRSLNPVHCYDNVTADKWLATKNVFGAYDINFENGTYGDVEVVIYEEDRITISADMVYSDITTLSSFLASLSTNRKTLPYTLFLRNVTSSRMSDLHSALYSNLAKYVDLSLLEIPINSDCESLFEGCTNLVASPVLPNTTSTFLNTFKGCSNLSKFPNIPNGVTNLEGTFDGCSSAENTPILPSGVTTLKKTFRQCKNMALTGSGTTPIGIRVTRDHSEVYGWAETFEQSIYGQTYQAEHPEYDYQPATTAYIYNGQSLREDVTFLNMSLMSSSSEGLMLFIWISADSTMEHGGFVKTHPSNLSTYTNGNFYIPYSSSLNYDWCWQEQSSTLYHNGSPIFYSDLISLADGEQIYSSVYGETYTIIKNSIVIESTLGVPYTQTFTIPSTVTDLESTFEECFFTTSPTIPSGVTSMKNTFNTSKLTSAPTLPSGLLNMEGTFEYCFDLVTPPTIPSSVTNMKRTFNGCSSLTTAPTLPSGVTDLTSTFESTLLTTSPTIPSGVTSMDSTFKNCSRLVTVTNVPSTVTRGKYAFLNCSSLKKISEFLVSTTTLDSADFRDMFKGCTALEEIGHKVEAATDLHLVYLYFDSNSHVQGKIYSRDKTSVTIAQTTVTKTTLTLPILTDELLFDSTLGTTDIENIIEGTAEQSGMLDTHYSWFGKIVIPPTGNYFVLYAKDKDKFKTNLEMGSGSGIEVYPTEEAIIQDLPNLDDDDIVATYGDDHAVNDVPLGSIIAYWGTTDPVDKKWLVLDGRDTTGTDIELQTHYPSLYLHLGGTNVLPDLRECVPVGIGQNGTDTIATHDVYTLGQFKDDQMQYHKHKENLNNGAAGTATSNFGGVQLSSVYASGYQTTDITTGRSGTQGQSGDTTHGKQKGVNWIIKAVSTADVTPLPSESIQEIEGYVEEYVDEKVSDIDNFKIIESSSVSVTLNANAGNFVTVSITVPNGYKSMFMTGYDISGCSGGINVYATESQAFFNKTGTFTTKIWVRNYTSSQLTATSITAYIMCLKQ